MVLVAGVAVLLLAVGGLAWALVNKGKDQGGLDDNGGGTVPATGSSSASPGSTATAPGAQTDGGTIGGGNDGGNGGTVTPPQTVKVYAETVHGSYSGTCPPPEAEAPAFRATITVGRTPAAVDYRWATKSGESSGSGWKTLHFAAGGSKQKQVSHTELTYKANETHHDRIRVKVQSPVEVRSNWIDFSVTCEQEPPPTDESSYTPDIPNTPNTPSAANTASAANTVFRRAR
ncbi:hypothetical protein [Streptomyces sp. NPDC000880]